MEERDRDPQGCGGNAAPYVLGALTEQEHEDFRTHLETCAICREEVAALQVVAANLPAAAPQVSAPPELKRRVMASVKEDARVRIGETAPARPSRRTGFGWRPAFAAVAVAAAIALAVILLVPSGGSGTRVVSAQVTPPQASASLRVSGDHAELDVVGMPQLPPGHVYEVWVQRAGALHPTNALFGVTHSGSASVNVPGGAADAQAVLVTAEPQGGSAVPTSMPVITARLS
jgi:anti-sigma-K factor RskA